MRTLDSISMEFFSLEWFGNECWTSLCCCINARKWWHSISLVLIEDCWSPWIGWAHENNFVVYMLESLLCALCLNCMFCFFSLHSSFQGCQKIWCVCAIFKIAEKICVCEFYASRVCIQVCLWFFLPLKLSSLQKASIVLLCRLLLLKPPSNY